MDILYFIFSLADQREKVKFDNVPTDFEGLKKWLPEQKTKFGNDTGIEGIVWHNLKSGEMCKIKIKDFDFKG